MARVLFHQIDELITNRGCAEKAGVGVTEEDLGIVRGGALLWDSAKGILALGGKDDIPRGLARSARKVNLKGKILAPALADCHTHLVFAGSRHHELALRLSGATYQQIAAAGGGIASTVRATREASEAELLKTARERLLAMRALGVGIVEMKSGYGLDWPTERKQLRVARKLQREFRGKMAFQSTFLGAHAFPPEARSEREREEYGRRVADEMLPRVAAEGLADACDVFCDEGYYSLAQARRILGKAKSLGLSVKLHADELAETGGAALAAELGALSADHLLKPTDAGLGQMARSRVVAVILPLTALYLGVPYAPVERMRKAGLCLALATDFNPGTSPSFHLPFVMSLACFQMGLSMAEAFAAATYGGARALGLHEAQGHLAAGMKPRLAIFRLPSYQALIAQVAHPGLCEAIL